MTTQSPTIYCFTPTTSEERVRAILPPLDASVQYTNLDMWHATLSAGETHLVLWYVETAQTTFPTRLEELRTVFPETPLIILAEPAAEPQVANALGHGVTDYVLTTPPQLKRLPHLVRRAIEERRLQAQLQAATAEVQLSRRAMAAVNDGLVLVNMVQDDGPVIYCNPAFTRMTGYTTEEVIGRNCRFLQGPETDAGAIEQIRHALRHHQPCHVELLNYRRDGTPFWNELSLAPVFGKNGQLTHYIGSQRDVTERRQTEERLRQELLAREAAEELLRTAETHYRTLVEHLPMAISTVVLDSPNPTPYVSPQIERLLGFTAEEWVRQPWLRAQQTHPDDTARLAVIAAKARTQGNFQVELRMFHREGHVVWIQYDQQIIAVDGQRLLLATISDITQRKEAEEALRESNERYDLAVHGSSDGIWDWKVPSDQAYFSPRFRELMGYAGEVYLGGMASLVAVVHPDDLKQTTDAINAHLTRGAPFKVEYRLRTVSGEYRWFLVRGQAIWDEEGQPVRMAGSLTDIHDGKVAQQELEQLNRTLEVRIAERTALLDKALRNLQESEHRLRTVVANAPLILFSFDRKGAITIAEGRGLAQIGLEPGFLIGQSVLDLNRDEPEMLTNIRRVLAGETLEAIYEVAGATFETRYIPLLHDGAVTGAISVSIDITARKRAEEELARSLKYAQSVTETSPDIVYIYDLLANRNVSSNHAIERILGYTPEEIHAMGDSLFPRLMHPDDLAALPAHQEVVRQLHDGAVAEFEYRMRSADGTWRWLFGRDVIFQRLPDGTAHLTLGVVSDITERKRAEQALRERSVDLAQANAALARAAQLKDEFLAGMSHELRTPLNAILGHSELLEEEIHGPLTEKQHRSVAAITEAGNHLLALINDILDLSKIEASRLVLEPEPVSINDLCQTAMRMVTQTALQKRLRLSLTMGQSVGDIEADPRRLKQILVNLLSNAVKFTPEGGNVSLVVKDGPQSGFLTFTVRDTGIGISPDDQRRLFQPFVQIDSSLSRQHNGTGLGLALVMRLVRLHHGSIALESVPGEGSSFSVCLPVTQSSAATLPEVRETSFNTPGAEASTTTSVTERQLILLADDSQANIDLLKDYLTISGYEVAIANNGLEAVARAIELHPALILMDIQMPLLDGLEAIRRIRARGDNATPIIALTALAMRGDRERCLAAGANAYITKPVNMRTLRSIVGDQLSRAGYLEL